MPRIAPCALALVLALLRAGPLSAQAPASVEAQADGRLSFRCAAPGASRVLVDLEGERALPMARDAKGLWQATTPPLPPDVYTYTFVVDGVRHEDPGCADAKPILTGGHESLVEVPAAGPQPWDCGPWPHGALHRHRFRSRVFGEPREVWVYTPPGYDPSRAYPMLCLLHGVMEDARAWTTAGRADLLLDALIGRKQAVPMVVVFPLGYGFPDAPAQVQRLFLGVKEQRGFMDAFGRGLFDEILPLVERNYHLRKGPAFRALAGASMGGAQALYLGLTHPDAFGRVGAFSGAFTLLGDDLDPVFPRLDAAHAPSVWLACGAGDFLLGPDRACAAWLKSKRIPITEVETPGAHTWRVWRRDLLAFAPTLFRPRAE